MSELDKVEAAAYIAAVVASGGSAARMGDLVSLRHPGLPIVEMNRVLALGPDADAASLLELEPAARTISVAPEAARIESALQESGYRPGYAWMKFERDVQLPELELADDLRVVDVGAAERDAFGAVGAAAFGLPPAGAAIYGAVAGLRGWHCFLVLADDEPATAGALFVDGDVAWFGMGGTHPDFRRRGGQAALMRARVERARELGVRRLTTETGERAEGRPAASYRNILRAGFREAYLRPNWVAA